MLVLLVVCASALANAVDEVAIDPSIEVTTQPLSTLGAPGSAVPVNVAVKNTGAELSVSGEVEFPGLVLTTTTLKSWWATLDVRSAAGTWEALGGAAGTTSGYTPLSPAPTTDGLEVEIVSIPTHGVTYPANGADQVLGTRIAGFPSARWRYRAKFSLSRSQLDELLPASSEKQVRMRFHGEAERVGVFNLRSRVVHDRSATFGQMLRSQTATVNQAAITVAVDGQSPQAFGPSTHPALSAIESGQEVVVSASATMPAVSPKGLTESDVAYLDRLREALARSVGVTAGVSYELTGAAKPLSWWPLPDLDPPFTLTSSPSAIAHAPPTTIATAVPIVEVSKVGPQEAAPGETATYAIQATNAGNAAATASVVDDVDGIGTSSVPGFGLIPAGSSAAASHSVLVPASASGAAITDTASATWTDAIGNLYGPLSASVATPLLIDSTPPPPPVITAHPRAIEANPNGSFEFGGEPAGRFECTIDEGATEACIAPKQFEGLTEGVHSFGVRQIDDAGNAGSWTAYIWTIDLTAPALPAITSRPAAVTSADSVAIDFEGESDAGFWCSTDAAPESACESPHHLQTLTEGEHTFAVRQEDRAGNYSLAETVTWLVDRTPPLAPILAQTPGTLTNQDTAGFGFTGESGGRYVCSLDGAPYEACDNPITYEGLQEGPRTFGVKQMDDAGNAGQASGFEWTIDVTAPAAPTITSRPPAIDMQRDSSLAFDGEDQASFECEIDSGGFAACESPLELSDLMDGEHNAAVRQTDQAGNVGPSAEFTWQVMAAAPVAPELIEHPAGLTNQTTATFAIGSDPANLLECRLDAAAYTTCASSESFEGLGEGTHRFDARQTAPSGQSSEAASFEWTIDVTPPVPPEVPFSTPQETSDSEIVVEWIPSSDAYMECADEGGDWYVCESPFRSGPVEPGVHGYGFRWRDYAGNEAFTGFIYWAVSGPDPPVITRAPAAASDLDSAHFEFTTPDGASVECSLDEAPFSHCESPYVATGLTDGQHSLSVRSVGSSGTTSSATTFAWTSDSTPPPEPTIAGGATGDWAYTSTTFNLEGEDGAILLCRIDHEPFRTCGASKIFNLLSLGAHRFEARQRDSFGRYSPAAVREWNNTVSPSTAEPTAPALSSTGVAPFADQVSFLYEGDDAIQAVPDPNVFSRERLAVVRGKVTDTSGSPVAGTRVSIVGHPEFGDTLSRDTGEVYLVVNGGARLTVRFETAGAPTVDRVVNAPWRDYVFFDPVVITPRDTMVSHISLDESSNTGQVAESSTVVDPAGVRSTSVVFPAGVTAAMTMADGSSSPLNELDVRITDFTVGATGPDAMPAPLPATSAYTYAADFSVDQALNAGATGVKFSEPVYAIVDNFRNFPTDMTMPQGFYDYEATRWEAEADGVVLKVHSVSGGSVTFEDADGNPRPSSMPAGFDHDAWNAITAFVASQFEAGDSFWLVPMNHFSTYDFNVPGGGGGARPPGQPDVNGSEKDPCIKNRSVVECENQTLGERVDIPGTDMSLNYRSDRAPGRVTKSGISVKVSGASVPDEVERIEAFVRIAGRTEHRTFPNAPNQTWEFKWDGLDWAGRGLTGTHGGSVEIEYVYPGYYRLPLPASNLPAWASVGADGRIGAAISYGLKYHIGSTTSIELEAPSKRGDRIMGAEDVAGWSVSTHDRYDPLAQSTIRGDGSRAHPDELDISPSRIAGLPWERWPENQGSGGEGGEYNSSTEIGDDALPVATTRLSGLSRTILALPPIAALGSPDANDPAGIGDGGPAKEAKLESPDELATAADGSVVVADGYRIRRVALDGSISTIAGIGQPGNSGDGGPAVEAAIGQVEGIAIDETGNVYFAQDKVVRAIGTDGIIRRYAGNGSNADDAPGDLANYRNDGPALEARLGRVEDLAINPVDGLLYMATENQFLVRRVTGDGRVESIGQKDHPTRSDSTHGSYPMDSQTLAVAQNGTIYVAGQNVFGYVIAIDPTTFEAREVMDLHAVAARNDIPGVTVLGEDIYDLAVTQDGRLYVLTTETSRSLNYTYSSRTMYLWKSNTGAQSLGSVGWNAPSALATDAHGDLYFTKDYGVSRYGPTFTDHLSTGVSIPDPTGETLSVFDDHGRHIETRSTRTNAVLRSFEYDDENRLSVIVDGHGNRTMIERNSAGDPTAFIAPFGQRTELSVNSNHLLSSVVVPGGAETSMTYDSDGLMQTFTKPSGGTSTFEYDAGGRLVRDDDALGGHLALNVSGSQDDYTVEITNARGRESTNRVEHLPNGSTRRTIDKAATGASTRIERSDGSSSSSGPGGDVESSATPDERFGFGVLVPTESAATTPSGLTSTVQTNDSFDMENWWDPSSWNTRTTRETVNGAQTTTTYDKEDNQLTESSPLGRTTVTDFNERLQPTKVTAPGTTAAEFSYDGNGRVSSVQVGDRTSTFAYDQRGNLQSATDAAGQSVQYEYDAADRVTEEQLPGGRTIGYSYDAAGNLTAVTPPSRPAHQNLFDVLGNVTSMSAPDISGSARETKYEYNGTDNELTKITRPSGRTVQLSHDSAGRVESVQTADGDQQFEFDPDSGNTTRATSDSGQTTAFGYDGSLPTAIEQSGEATGNVTVAYDNFFRPKVINSPGQVTNLSYDDDSALIGAGDLSVSRHPGSGLISSSSLANTTSALTHSQYGEPISSGNAFPNGGHYNETYARDAVGRITQKTVESATGTDNLTYVYDPAGRLTSVQKNGAAQESYTYDANSNRTTATYAGDAGSTTINATFDARDRMTTYGNLALSYNDDGELTEKQNTQTGEATTYTYSTLGQLRGATLPSGQTLSYVYDASGNLVAKKSDNQTERAFLYAPGSLSPVTELDAAGSPTANFIYATRGAAPDYMVKNGQKYRIITDQIGSVKLVVNAESGSVEQAIEYDAFGRVLSDSNPGFQPFGFAGGIYDTDTKLTHFGAREYDAELGRWTSSDPISFAGGDSNLYGYVLQDPVNLIDPTGLAGLHFNPLRSATNGARKTAGDAGMYASNFAAGALNGAFLGLPNTIAGVSGKCIGPGGGAGKLFGTGASLLYGAGEIRASYLAVHKADDAVRMVKSLAPSRVPEMEAAASKAGDRFVRRVLTETGTQTGGTLVDRHNEQFGECC